MIANPVFIKVPSVYSVKLPGGEWLNLAQMRQIKPGDAEGKLVVIWDTGEFDIYIGAKAEAILEAMSETTHIDKSGMGGKAIA